MTVRIVLLALAPAVLSAQPPAQPKTWHQYRAEALDACREGRLDEAEALFETARGKPGADPRLIATMLRDLAGAYEKNQRAADAERVYRRIFEIWKGAAGDNDAVVTVALADLAGNLRRQKKLEETEAAYAAAAQMMSKCFGSAEPAYADSLRQLADFYIEEGRAAEAARAYREVMQGFSDALGPENGLLPEVMEKYASLAMQLGEPVEASEYARRAAAIRSAKSVRNNPNTVAPQLVEKLEPEYTEAARSARVQGTVVLYVSIGEDGTPRRVGIVRPVGLGLDQNAVAAVKAWRFRPAQRNGAPVAVDANVEVNFRLL